LTTKEEFATLPPDSSGIVYSDTASNRFPMLQQKINWICTLDIWVNQIQFEGNWQHQIQTITTHHLCHYANKMPHSHIAIMHKSKMGESDPFGN
jgi:hypothetical protein